MFPTVQVVTSVGIPFVYELDSDLRPVVSMQFLGDEETVRKAIESVAAQGKAKKDESKKEPEKDQKQAAKPGTVTGELTSWFKNFIFSPKDRHQRIRSNRSPCAQGCAGEGGRGGGHQRPFRAAGLHGLYVQVRIAF